MQKPRLTTRQRNGKKWYFVIDFGYGYLNGESKKKRINIQKTVGDSELEAQRVGRAIIQRFFSAGCNTPERVNKIKPALSRTYIERLRKELTVGAKEKKEPQQEEVTRTDASDSKEAPKEEPTQSTQMVEPPAAPAVATQSVKQGGKARIDIYYGDSIQTQVKDTYANFYYWLSDFKELDIYDMLIYTVIADYEKRPYHENEKKKRPYGYANISAASIGNIIHFSPKHVNEHIRKLCDMGALTKIQNGVHRYLKTIDFRKNQLVKGRSDVKPLSDVKRHSVPMYKDVASPYIGTERPRYNNLPTYHNNNMRNADTLTRKQKKENAIDTLFTQFWQMYPKKLDKKKAKQAFSKIKHIEKIFPVVLKALERQKQSANWQKDGGQWIPYPTTWLNGERWNDELQRGVSFSQPEEEQESESERAARMERDRKELEEYTRKKEAELTGRSG